jgi:hypothetical protein
LWSLVEVVVVLIRVAVEEQVVLELELDYL